MRSFIFSLRILIIIALLGYSFAQAQTCSNLFERSHDRVDAVYEINRSLKFIQMISHAGIQSYQVNNNQHLIVLYDKPRSDIVVTRDSIKPIVTPEGQKQNSYPYSRDQVQALSENLLKLSQQAVIAVVDPYTVNPQARNTNRYGLFETAEKVFSRNSRTIKLRKIHTDESTAAVYEQYLEAHTNAKTQLFIGFSAAVMSLTIPEVNIGAPMFFSALGYSIHSLFNSAKNFRRIAKEEHIKLSQELTEKALKESDSEFIILIVPESARSSLDAYLNSKAQPHYEEAEL